MLFREGVRLGLDRDDHIIRQRIIEKVLVLAEDLGGAARPPTENDLKDYFAATRGQWIEPARVTLVHIFLSPAHRDQAEALRTRAQADAGPEDDPPPLGDAFPLRRKLTATEAELQKDYGADFARVAFALEPRTWSDMVASVHGLHLIKVLQRTAQHPASYEEVRERLPMDYLLWRKHEATTSFLREAFARYRIEADGVPVTGYQPTGRVAPGRASGGD